MAPSALVDAPSAAVEPQVVDLPPAPPAAFELHVRYDEKVPILVLPPDQDLEAMRVWFSERLPAYQAALSGRTARLDLGGRTLHLLELRRLIHFLRETWDIEITGVYALPEAVHRFAERELRLKLFLHDPAQVGPAAVDAADLPPDDVPQADEDEPPTVLDAITLPHDLEPDDLIPEPPPTLPEPTHTLPDQRTLSLHRTLRSGTVVRFDGDVYVFGDVNPGAQVVASGNLIVLGALKGMAWAGATGDDAIILAHLLRPTQLRIGRKIATVPDRPGNPTEFSPEMASIVDGQIAITPYQGRVRGK